MNYWFKNPIEESRVLSENYNHQLSPNCDVYNKNQFESIEKEFDFLVGI
jgi:hypothetical protein